MTIALMIDIETLSLRPDAFVTQVGYCINNLDTGEYLVEPFNLWVSEEGQEHRHKDINTIAWWVKQDPAIAREVFDPNVPKIHHARLFDMLREDVVAYEVDEVWASPAMFDLPILTSLWDGRKPWGYKQERCLMTIYKRLDPDGRHAPPENPKHHDAAADAKWQMDYLINLHYVAQR